VRSKAPAARRATRRRLRHCSARQPCQGRGPGGQPPRAAGWRRSAARRSAAPHLEDVDVRHVLPEEQAPVALLQRGVCVRRGAAAQGSAAGRAAGRHRAGRRSGAARGARAPVSETQTDSTWQRRMGSSLPPRSSGPSAYRSDRPSRNLRAVVGPAVVRAFEPAGGAAAGHSRREPGRAAARGAHAPLHGGVHVLGRDGAGGLDAHLDCGARR
jgi:hypothetical protein